MMNKKLTKGKAFLHEKQAVRKYFSFFFLLFSLIISAQNNLSTDQNFVYTKSCLDADCIKKSEVVQYYDGLGRPVQAVGIKATPLGKDVVTPFEYNPLGKQVKDYLPIPQQGTSGGAFYTSPNDNASSIYGSEKIYSEKIYDQVYTDRVKQVVSVGSAWAQKPVNLGYETNLGGEVKKYTVTTTWAEGRTDSQITLSAPYAANQLMKTSATDEDGNTTVEFRNGEGQTVLVRKNDGTQDVDTYYLYNEYGQLAYVIPPLAVGNTSPDQATLDNLCYQYRYDGMGKTVEKKVPGKGWEYLIYDKQDRVIMSQDANLRRTDNTFLAKGWMFTKYDKFGRVVYTGFYPSEETRAVVQNSMNTLTVNPENNESRSAGSFASDGMDVFYTQNAFPAAGIKVLSVNYYDTYPVYSFNPAFPTSVIGQSIITDAQNAAISTRTLPTMSAVKNIENDSWTKSYIWYDDKARAVATYSINHLGGYTRTESELEFAGTVKQTKVYHKRLNSDSEKVISQVFEYDAQNRLKKQWHQVGSNPQELLAENSYNELSQLSNRKTGSSLQSIDYTYNIKGSVTKVNDPSSLGTKLFGYELKYFNPQNTSGSAGKYNGNIAEVTWKSATDGVKRRYNYQYDALNRLTKGIYSEPEVSVPQNDLYNETVTYDMNSNILSLHRNTKGISGTASQMDNLVYGYANNGRSNRLNFVTDTSTNYSGYPDTSGNIISYDDNGNMTNQTDKGILEIKYNVLSLPDYVKFDKTYVPKANLGGSYNVNVMYLYRADGTKLKKTYTYGSATNNTETATATEYLDGFQYEATSTTGKFTMGLKFIPTSEGYYDFEKNRYIYSYTDHLGNIRVSYFKNTSGSAEVLEENNFYPFGLKHEGYNAQTGNPSYNYQYNGKELQKETGWSDYGARMYMSDIARWGVIDPLAEQYRRLTPYNYVANNPINFIDPDGRKMQAPKGDIDPVPSGLVPGGMMDYYARGGTGKTSDLLKFLGQEDMMGSFFALMSGGGGGGGSSAGTAVTYNQAIAFLYFGNIDFSQFTGEDPPGNALSRFRDRTSNWVQDNIREPLSGWLDNNTRNTFVLDAAGQARMDDMRSQMSGYMNSTVGGGIRWGAEHGLVGSGLGTGNVGAFRKASKALEFTIAEAKFNYFFGKVTTGDLHNIQRSAQNLKDLNMLGIKSESQLIKIFSKALAEGIEMRNQSNKYGTTITKSIEIGQRGRINVAFFYEGGDLATKPRVTTLIPQIYR
jgi:RHS repeat-associated protein